MIRRSCHHAYLGFTLVEILVVVAIFAVLSTVSLISIQRSKERTKTQNMLQLVSSSIEKLKGNVLGGRSFNNSLGVPSVARSYGVSIDLVSSPNTFTVFADFPPEGVGAPDSSLVPHCYAGGDDTGCDPFSGAGFPKRDSVIEENIFTSDRVFDRLTITTGPGVSTDVDRVDLVYLVPTNETAIYYYDSATNEMVKLNVGADAIFIAARINSVPPSSSNEGWSLIFGGLIGGHMHTIPQ